MPAIISDPLCISLSITLAGVGLEWDDITAADDSDASYKRALDTVICAGLVDAKVEVAVTMQGRLGSIRAMYLCHGGCDVLLNEDADEHARHNAEWLNADGRLAGPLIIKKHIHAVRLSATSIEDLKLDRPNEKLAILPKLVDRLAECARSGNYWDQSPWIELLDIGISGQSGPDPDNEGVFYWQGQAHRLTKRNWQLLRAIWGHEEVNIPDVGELVWGDGLKPESTIRGQLNRLNKQMARFNIPLAWRIEAGQIIPEAK